MAKVFSTDCMIDLVFHTISNMKRIKRELMLAEILISVDYAGFVVLKTKDSTNFNYFLKTIIGVLRDSDAVFIKDDIVYIFFPGTDISGVESIISDLTEFYKGSFEHSYDAFSIKDIKNEEEIKEIINNLQNETLKK